MRIGTTLAAGTLIALFARPCMADIQSIIRRSGEPGPVTGRDPVVRCVLGPPVFGYVGPIPASAFAAARTGGFAYFAQPAPGWGNVLRNTHWVTSLPTGWVNGQTSIYALPFPVAPDALTDRWTGRLRISFMAADALGDAQHPGLYLNEVPLAASVGGTPGAQTTWSFDIPVGGIHAGENWLYLYVPHTVVAGDNPEGVYFTATLTARPLSAGPAPAAGYATIQDAVNAAADGDIIPVLPGVYNEAVRIEGKSLTLSSTGGAAVTTITSNDPFELTLLVNGSELSGTVELEGFTLTQGPDAFFSVGSVSHCAATFRNCMVLPGPNSFGFQVAAQQGADSTCRFENCLMRQSVQTPRPLVTATAFSGVAVRSEVTMTGCTLIGAVGRGGVPTPAISLLTESNTSMAFTSAQLSNCIVRGFGDTPFTTSVSGSTPQYGRAQVLSRYSNIDHAGAGWPGPGNIDADPLFVETVGGTGGPGDPRGYLDFRLLPGSPCIDAGLNTLASGAKDLDGLPRVAGANAARVDMGAYEFVPHSCGTDFNHDGETNPDDLGDFITAFFSGCP